MDPTNRGGPQTTRNWAWRDYGNRVGNWRLFEILDELKLPATILLNSSVCYHYPDIVDEDQSARRRRVRPRPHQCRAAEAVLGA